MRAQDKKYFDVENGIYSNGKESHDLSKVNIINTHVDSYKQYYWGELNQFYLDVKKYFEENGHESVYNVRGVPFALTKLFKRAGYRYKLQNNEVGLVIMIGSYFTKETYQGLSEGSHLKIECSPHYLINRPAKLITNDLAAYAEEILSNPRPICGVPHLAVDTQGWSIPDDFSKRFVTRLSLKRDYSGMSSGELEGQMLAVRHGVNESITIGSASGLQLSVYNKTIEAKKSGKLAEWNNVWFNANVEFETFQDVIRFEWRIPKVVIQQITDMNLRTYEEVFNNANSLWFYCCIRNRLHHSARYVDPMWQFLTENVQFNDAEPIQVKREYGKKKPLIGRGGRRYDTTRNMLSALGHLCTVYAARGFYDDEIIECVKSSGIWDELTWYYLFKENWSENKLEEYIIGRVKKRRYVK